MEAQVSELLAGQKRIEATLASLDEAMRELRESGKRQDSKINANEQDMNYLQVSALDAARAGSKANPDAGAESGVRSPPTQDGSMVSFLPSESSTAREVVHRKSARRPSSRLSRSMSSTSSLRSFVAHTLPRGWPSTLEMRELGDGFAEEDAELALQVSPDDDQAAVMTKQTTERPGLNSQRSTLTMSRFTIDPNSTFGMVCDVLCLVILVYDLTTLPYILAWGVEIEGWLLVVVWCTTIFWTVDIARSFLTCIYVDGNLVRDVKVIGKNYMRTWFMIDACVVVSDWISMVLGSASSSMKILRLAKMGRMLRILGVMRMLRFVRVMEDFAERSLSESHRLGMRILTILMGIIWLTHLMCCLWFAIGQMSSDTGAKWTDVTLMNDLPFLEAGEGFQYMSSFHWAVAQLTLGAVEIVCTNTIERIYNVLCLLVGLIFGSALVSSLSATMVELQERSKDKTTKVRLLRRYMKENFVESKLSTTVMKQAMSRLNQQPDLTEKDVPTLALLSNALRNDLRCAIFEPYINRHPLFRLWWRVDRRIVQDLTEESVDFIFLRPHDDLFQAGITAEYTYLMIDGSLEYAQDPSTSAVLDRVVKVVTEQTWLCLAAMWSQWVTVGDAVARSSCKLMTVNPHGVIKAMSRHALIDEISKQYGKSFQRRLRAAEPPQADFPNDLEVPFTEFGDIVISMQADLQVRIGMVAVKQLVSTKKTSAWSPVGMSSAMNSSTLDKLSKEVSSGKTILMETGTGEVERVVAVIALDIENSRGQVFAQIGKFEDDKLIAACQLPGGKQERGEMTQDAMKRLLESKIPWLVGNVAVQNTERQVTEKVSKDYGIRTKYLRTVCKTKLLSQDVGAAAWRANKELRSDERESTLSEYLLANDVYKWEGKGKAAFYTFLPKMEFDRLSQGGAEAELLEWLSMLEQVDGSGAAATAEADGSGAAAATEADGNGAEAAPPPPPTPLWRGASVHQQVDGQTELQNRLREQREI